MRHSSYSITQESSVTSRMQVQYTFTGIKYVLKALKGTTFFLSLVSNIIVSASILVFASNPLPGGQGLAEP